MTGLTNGLPTLHCGFASLGRGMDGRERRACPCGALLEVSPETDYHSSRSTLFVAA
jgi:hypothetical protein